MFETFIHLLISLLMAKQKETKALYTVAVDVLLRKGSGVIAAARRDLNLPDNKGLADFGYTPDSLNAIEALGEVVSEMPTDEEYVGVLVEKTAAKDSLADSLREQIGGIVARATTFYGADSGPVRRYGAGKLSKMTDGQLWQCAKRTARVGTKHLDDLKAKGLTQGHLDELIATYGKFDTARDEQDDAIRDRDIATQDRVRAANKYYQALQPLCADGQAKLGPIDEARANDYVWEPAPEGSGEETPAEPQ